MLAEKVQKLEQENESLKEQLEELQERYSDRAYLPKSCEYCEHFQQHYIRTGNVYSPVYDGHCVAGNRIKSKRAGETCKSFTEKKYGKNFI